MRTILLTSFVPLVVACSSSSSGPATFESASDLELSRTMSAALSFDSVILSFIAAGYAGEDDTLAGATACPKISTVGGKRHIVGGCTTEDGRVDGELILDNVPGLLGNPGDPTKPMSIEANDFVLGGGEGGDIRFDGTMSSIPNGVSEISLDVLAQGINVHSEMRLSCPAGLCTYESAAIDVEGVGSATITGSFSFTGAGSIALEVKGADTLSVATEGNCLTYSVGARTGKQCNQSGGSSGGAFAGLELRGGLDTVVAQPR